MSNNIGKCISSNLNEYNHDEDEYRIQYKYVPDELIKNFSADNKTTNTRLMYSYEIIYWSKNKDELEEILLTKKYNL